MKISMQCNVKFGLIALLAIFSFHASARTVEFGFGAQGALTNFNVDAPLNSYMASSKAAIGVSAYGKLRFQNRLVVEAGGSAGYGERYLPEEDESHYSYDEVFARAGYEWRIAKHFTVTPLLGIHETKVYFYERMYSGSNVNSRRLNESGFGTLGAIRLGVPVGKRAEVFYQAQHNWLQFGDLDRHSLGVSVLF